MPTPYLTRAKFVPVERQVMCLTHGGIHEDTTDPYDSGDDRCKREEHRRVYYLALPGDIDETLTPE